VKGTRAFVAIELDDRVLDALEGTRRTVSLMAPEWAKEKWVVRDNLHITLAFLGDLGSSELAEITKQLTPTLPNLPAFAVHLGEVVAMPPRGRHTMLWATLADPNARCRELATIVAVAASQCGIILADKPFTPHITLVRSRRPRRMSAEVLASASASILGDRVSMSVASATLFASTLTPNGPVYERITQWNLAGTA
jgi:2'-5' RNA ligase